MSAIVVTRPDLDTLGADVRGFKHHAAASEPRAVRMFISVIAPGEDIPPHIHPIGTETWVYVLRGRVLHRHGSYLHDAVTNSAGDLLHIQAGIPHQPVNLSAEQPVIALIACNYDQNDPAAFVRYDPVTDTRIGLSALPPNGPPVAATPASLEARCAGGLDTLRAELQDALIMGWRALLGSERYSKLRDFAVFLDALPEFQSVHRPRHPHPPHEYAARDIGIPFMAVLRRHGLFLSACFPGDFEASTEAEWPDPYVDANGRAQEVVARVFHSDLLRPDDSRLCRVSIAFPHLHEGFGFPFPPRLSIRTD